LGSNDIPFLPPQTLPNQKPTAFGV